MPRRWIIRCNRVRPVALVGVLAALLLPSIGCSHVKTPVLAFNDDGEYLPRDVGDGLVRKPNSLIPDVPMPVGFKAVASQSNWQYDGKVRVVNHVYQGHAEPGDAVAFYQRVLPQNQWKMVDIQAIGETTVMRYTKGSERLSVTTEDGWATTTIKINIDAR